MKKSLIPLVIFALSLPVVAHAATSGGAISSWTSALGILVSTLTGPVAFDIGIIGAFVGMAGFAFARDMNGMMRDIFIIVLVCGVLLSVVPFLNELGFTGAVIP